VNNSETIDKMKEMKLYGMASAMASAMDMGIKDITPDELVAHLIDAEWDDRHEEEVFKTIKGCKV